MILGGGSLWICYVFSIESVLFTEAKKSPEYTGTSLKGTAKKEAGQVFFHQVNVNFTLPPGKAIFSKSPLSKHHRGVAQLASAPRSGRGGRRFESSHPDKTEATLAEGWGFVLSW